MLIKNRRPDIIFHLLCAMTIAIAAGTGTAAAQSSGPKTVADFLLLVPERYMEGYDLRFREELVRGEHRGVVVDIRNGYISYDASDNPSGFEFAVFRKSNGNYLVAYSTGAFYDPEFSKELDNWPTLLLLSYEGGKWRDVTSASLPVAFNKKLAYLLPRRGRGIEVWDGRGRRLYTLTWRNDRFRLDRVPRR
jgi:hypothetical protein